MSKGEVDLGEAVRLQIGKEEIDTNMRAFGVALCVDGVVLQIQFWTSFP